MSREICPREKKPEKKSPPSGNIPPNKNWQPEIRPQEKCPATPIPTKKPFGCIKKSLKKMIEGKAAINTEMLAESLHLCCVVQGLQIS